MYGVLVIGAPGAGKSTFCAGLTDIFSQTERPFLTVNLDPANDTMAYPPDVNITELITVNDVMDRLGLGPNGALKYCIETLGVNTDWLLQKIEANRKKYLIIDCPGQLELYKSEGELWKVIRNLEKAGVRLCALHLADSLYCSDPAKFLSVALSTLATMVTMEMPQVNCLSKADLFSADGTYDLDFFSYLPDVNRLLDLLNEVPGLEKYRRLNEAICGVISDFDLVSFVPLAVENKNSMMKVIQMVDAANGFALTEQGDIRELILNSKK
uniref:GPN-loop GTPase 2 n=1 Tax=Caenorhabditis japonica TaxID=281687 RepID=A0A8R1DRW3_CAEJA